MAWLEILSRACGKGYNICAPYVVFSFDWQPKIEWHMTIILKNGPQKYSVVIRLDHGGGWQL